MSENSANRSTTSNNQSPAKGLTFFLLTGQKFILHKLGLNSKKWLINTIFTILVIVIFALYLWSIAALYFLLPHFKLFGSIALAITVPPAIILIKPRRRTLLIVGGVVLIITVWQQSIPPTNDRDWQPSVARLPQIAVVGNEVRISNIRNFAYRSETDFTPRYYSRNFKLNELQSLDYILSYWDNHKAIAHVIFSFGFKNGDYLAVSVETRLAKGQQQSLLGGIFNQYGLIYILADERDVLRLRTNFRHEQVYLYRLKIKHLLLEKLFVEIIRQAALLEQKPRFYNTLKQNCLTTLLEDLRRAQGRHYQFDYRFVLNGYSDELLYDNGVLVTGGLPFKLLKEHSHINQYVENDPAAAVDYSKKIRPKFLSDATANPPSH